MIAFLHTSDIHIERFDKLAKKFDQGIEVKHFVNEDLLDFAMKEGVTDDQGFASVVQSIKNEKPDLIICTCSTYGEACNQSNEVERIDRPVVEYLVSNYKNIGLAFTAKSTQRVSYDLIVKTARQQNKQVKIVDCDCSSAWVHYEHKDFDQYARTIAQQIKAYETKVDVIFLAQASMENAKEYLSNFTKEIYASPEFGVRSYLQRNR